ncbi:hypothetical protein, partial [Bradyrhizobium viridifuturi]|uniref:hypothetical protein n=1 Tax=Bradyrhizobium viridifuturi TaxID=1654716 RepID=UPI003D3106D6
MSRTDNCLRNQRQNPITPREAYDPVHWQQCATCARARAGDAPAHRVAALKQEAADYERLAAYARAVQAATEAA